VQALVRRHLSLDFFLLLALTIVSFLYVEVALLTVVVFSIFETQVAHQLAVVRVVGNEMVRVAALYV
jgi:hypothetical protein